MKALPIYKCQRCGAEVLSGTNYLQEDELETAAIVITHECGSVWSDSRLEDDNESKLIRTSIGLCKLVGYDEYPD